MDKIIGIVGQAEYDRLKEISNHDLKYSVLELEDIKRRLTIELKHIESGVDFNDLPF